LSEIAITEPKEKYIFILAEFLTDAECSSSDKFSFRSSSDDECDCQGSCSPFFGMKRPVLQVM